MIYIRATLEACPIISAIFILAGIIGCSHAGWCFIDNPAASFTEIFGVDTIWFYPWLAMGFAFLAVIANGVAVRRSIRRLSAHG